MDKNNKPKEEKKENEFIENLFKDYKGPGPEKLDWFQDPKPVGKEII